MAHMAPARRRIRFLPPQLANQIAAGEVVERPASVLKELLENSLDADATRIDIDVEAGGIALIRVSDNGSGIERDDLVLALSRHATSKIGEVEDLHRLRTLGFRGEALASIGSVARLSLTSRALGADVAWRVRVEPGHEEPVPHPASRPVGTSVEVRDLFYNVPARRKFLRTERTELTHLEDVVKRVSLSHPEVTFTLRHHDRVLVQSPGAADHAGRARRVAGVFGNTFISEARWVEADAADMRLWGWLGPANLTRSQTDLQYVYVNGRIVRDRLLAHALRQAYQDALAPGRHPMYALHFEIAPSHVDVNVHPTKHEVRFRDARSVHDFVFASVRRALGDYAGRGMSVVDQAPRPAGGSYRHSPDGAYGAVDIGESARTYPGSAERSQETAAGGSPLGRSLGLVGERILLATQSEHLVVVDVGCAQRLLCRRDMLRALEAGSVVCRPLLIPVSVTVSEVHAEVAEAAAALLGRVGLDLSRAGAAQIMVRGVPSALAEAAPESLALGALQYLSGRSAGDITDAALVDGMVDAASFPPMNNRGEMDRLLCALAAAGEAEPGAARGACWVAVEPDSLEALIGGPNGRRNPGDEDQ